MNRTISHAAGLIILLVIISCTSDNGGSTDRGHESIKSDASDAAGELEVIRGHYVFGHEVRSLRPCGSDDALWVVDQTDLLSKLHGELAPKTTPYPEIFVVVEARVEPPPDEGFGADYSGRVSVEDVTYAAFEGFGCDFDWDRFDYRAQGNEPFWTMEVRQTEMRLTRPGHPERVWTDVKKDHTEDALIFHAIGEDRSTIQLVIESKPSRDTMSGAYYGLSSRLILDGESFTGTALRGSGTPAR